MGGEGTRGRVIPNGETGTKIGIYSGPSMACTVVQCAHYIYYIQYISRV